MPKHVYNKQHKALPCAKHNRASSATMDYRDAFVSTYRAGKQLPNYIITAATGTVLTQNQIEACRKVLVRILRRQKPKPTYISCLRLKLPYTQKSKNARMGKGKGSVMYSISRIGAGAAISVIRGARLVCATKALAQMEHKLPIHLSLVCDKWFM
jgi:ribosomal protein L16/L10AE